MNIIIEACHSGSFIDRFDGIAKSLSEDGRVVIASTGRTNNAYASAQGAYFSDAFFSAVAEGGDLLTCFNQAKAAVEEGIVLAVEKELTGRPGIAHHAQVVERRRPEREAQAREVDRRQGAARRLLVRRGRRFLGLAGPHMQFQIKPHAVAFSLMPCLIQQRL